MNRQRYVILGCEHSQSAAIMDVDSNPISMVCLVKPQCCDGGDWAKVVQRAEELRDMLNREQQVRDALTQTNRSGGKS